jgi:hypothetical protein
MSTGQQIHNEAASHSFETIDAHVNAAGIAGVTAPSAAQQTPANREQRLVTNYAAARPILVAVAAIPFIPANWRAVITALVVMLDEVSNSFKAGKDLAIGDGTINTMEPKLPA